MEQVEATQYPISISRSLTSRISQVDFTNVPFGKVFTDHMFLADYHKGEWSNAKIVPYDRVRCSPSISALHYGQLIFEGMKAYKSPEGDPVLFRPLMNYERLNRSARRMAMPEIPKEIFKNGLLHLLQLDCDWIPPNAGASLYIRPFMFATDEYIGIRASEHYRFMIIACPVGPYYDHPVKVKVSDRYVRAFKGGTGTAKTAGNYAATMMPVQEARKEGFDQVLWLDGCSFEYVHEIGTMNVFFVIDGKVVTPSTETGEILEGVTRDSVITILEDNGIPVEVRQLRFSEVYDAWKMGLLQDAFGTGTAATIAHIAELGYKGERMDLPPIETRTISNMVRETLVGIKRGRLEDKFDWVYRVPPII